MQGTPQRRGGLFGDNPIHRMDEDGLGREALCRGMARVLAEDGLELPLVAAIYGPWGSGKTSVLNMVDAAIAEISPHHLRVRFEAWPFAEDKDALWRALFLTVVEAIRKDALPALVKDKERAAFQERIDTLTSRLYRSVTTSDKQGVSVNWGTAASLASQGGLWLASQIVPGVELAKKTIEKIQERLAGEDAERLATLLSANEAELIREQITSLEQFRNELKILAKERLGDRGRRLFVFIDDLDRCLPEAAVKAVEALKVFLDLPDTAFVIAVDRTLIEHGVRIRYKALLDLPPSEEIGGPRPFQPKDFLDKIIQITFALPPVDHGRFENFLRAAWPGSVGLPGACDRILRNAIEFNPRTLKRVLNQLALTARAFEAAFDRPPQDEDMIQLTKLTVLGMCWPDIHRKAVEDPGWLLNVQAGRTASGVTALDKVLTDAAGLFSRETFATLQFLVPNR